MQGTDNIKYSKLDFKFALWRYLIAHSFIHLMNFKPTERIQFMIINYNLLFINYNILEICEIVLQFSVTL
jgi:hypothetical protein